MTSRCKRPVLPAFDLKVVQESVPDDHHAIQNAAACQEMSDVLSDLALGSWRDATDATLLKVRGVTHVLNVAKELPSPRELKAMESGEFACKTIPLMDCHSQDIAIHFQEAFEFIELARKQGGKVLVHCRRGISRSPAIVVGYLMRHDGRSFQEAVDFVKSKRTCISLNLAFQEMLAEYEPGKSLNGLDETSTRTESMGVDEFGLSAPESEKSTQPAKDQNWGDE